jgi:hypothetical protein
MRRLRVSDDRGRRVALLGTDDLQPETPEHVRSAVNDANLNTPSGALRVACILIVVSAFPVTVVWWAGWPQKSQFPALTMTPLLPLGFAAFVFAAGWFRASGASRRARAACLSAGLCPGCGYGLEGIPAQPDAMTVCAECGAAWQAGNPPA